MILNLIAILFCCAAATRSVNHWLYYNPERARYEADWWKMALGVSEYPLIGPSRRKTTWFGGESRGGIWSLWG